LPKKIIPKSRNFFLAKFSAMREQKKKKKKYEEIWMEDTAQQPEFRCQNVKIHSRHVTLPADPER